MRKTELVKVSVALGLVFSAGSAQAEREGEFGVFGGIHIFNDNNELGVSDAPESESLDNALTFGVRAAFQLFGPVELEGELGISPTNTSETSVDTVVFGWRAHALMHFTDGDFRPFALVGVGALTSSSEDERVFLSDTDFAVHAGVGLKYQVQDNWGVRCDARLLLPPSSDNESLTTDAEFLLGVYKEFGLAPKAAPVAPLVVDSDGDGIADGDDKCPNEAEDTDGYEDEDGCPEDQDTDGDGIADSLDTCPAEAEDIDGHADDDGCPDLDNDADGLADTADQCPDDAEDKDGFEDLDGCPDLDNDGDGVADTEDKGPADPETSNGFEDSDGCPDVLPKEVERFSGAIDGIRFKTGAATIRPSSFKTLDSAVAVFQQFSELRVEVQGHTDNRGSDDVNTQLSQDRAQAVVDYLVSKGIAAERLEAKGYGPSVPVGDNASAKGRETNRRVEFKLIN
jgi:OOP family OmpA-OmpF porin